MISLAIETSCDDTSVAVVEDHSVRSMKISGQVHSQYGGVVPEVASRMHEENIFLCAQSAMSGIPLSSIDVVSVTVCPGLAGPLLVGGSFAKGVALGLKIPIVGVNHIEAHAISAVIENSDLNPPFLSLVVSGGHTSIIDVLSYSEFKIYSQTRDDAAGEVLDKVARALGMSYPGGPVLDKMSFLGNKDGFSIPRPKFENFDFSFSGIKTWAFEMIKTLPSEKINDFVSSFVFGIFDYITENLIAIANNLGRTKIALGGGVSSSLMLRKIIKNKFKDYEIFIPSRKYCTDNAGMIGVMGIHNFKNGRLMDFSF